MISIGLLLGMSAAKRGSMDLLATKKISTQLEALLPPTATELPLSHTTQVAGLVGLGLLYQGTGEVFPFFFLKSPLNHCQKDYFLR